MKNIFKSVFFAIASLMLGVSCLNTDRYEGNDPTTADGAEIVTIVDGSYDTPYFVMFDNGRKAYVTENTATTSITFPSTPEQMRGEVRKVIYYNFMNEKHEGYDLSIKIVGMEDISTNLLKNIDDEEIAEQLPTHTASITVRAATLSKKYNYLTMRMYIKFSGQEQFKHSIILTHNKEQGGVFADVYKSHTDTDSYLWFELYHDSDTDYEYYIDEIYSTYKLDTEYLGVKDLSEYRGIKIIYKDINKMTPDVYTINF